MSNFSKSIYGITSIVYACISIILSILIPDSLIGGKDNGTYIPYTLFILSFATIFLAGLSARYDKIKKWAKVGVWLGILALFFAILRISCSI
ncbi:MAG: hypothetical protein KKA79_07735 [Nanoarchaeota archaeon]|nr:hypothetical protein [Nanoarchaeota archaeon]